MTFQKVPRTTFLNNKTSFRPATTTTRSDADVVRILDPPEVSQTVKIIQTMSDLLETLYGYKFSGVVDRDEWAVHDGPTQLGSDHDLLDFICQHVLTAPEIRITDRDDCLVMHIVEQELIFPLTGTNAVRGHVLVWDNERKQFKPGKSKA